MNKEKIVILNGAGAAIPWGAPSTEKITDGLKKDENFLSKSDLPLGQFLDNVLRKGGYANINFETIINTIETLYYFDYGCETNYDPYKQDISILFKPQDFYDDLFNSRYIHPSDNYPKGQFLFRVYQRYLLKIIDMIEDYSNESRIKASCYSPYLSDFLGQLEEKYVIRSYTLNYDNLFPDACPSINFFNGFCELKQFDCEPEEYCEKVLIEKIVNEDGINCYYNLHGSIYYHLKEVNGEYKFYFKRTPSYLQNIEFSMGKGNPNEFNLSSPIITGYRKIQRISQEPFNAFYNSFFRDSFNSKLFIVIGYSFSDPHINSLLKGPIERGAKIINIGYIKPDELSTLNNNLPPAFNAITREIFNNSKFDRASDYIREELWWHSEVLNSYMGGFGSFLSNKEWEKIC